MPLNIQYRKRPHQISRPCLSLATAKHSGPSKPPTRFISGETGRIRSSATDRGASSIRA